MQGKIYTIYNLCWQGEEHFYFEPTEEEAKKDDELFLWHKLGDEGYCDAWDFVKAEDAPAGYAEERRALIDKYNKLEGCSFEWDFCSRGALNESIKSAIEFELSRGKKFLDCLDYQSLFLMGNKVNIIFDDGSERLAESVDDIANLDGLAMFEIVEY